MTLWIAIRKCANKFPKNKKVYQKDHKQHKKMRLTMWLSQSSARSPWISTIRSLFKRASILKSSMSSPTQESLEAPNKPSRMSSRYLDQFWTMGSCINSWGDNTKIILRRMMSRAKRRNVRTWSWWMTPCLKGMIKTTKKSTMWTLFELPSRRYILLQLTESKYIQD